MYESLREKHGDVYLISFPDGTDIPWRPLTYGDFVHYQALQNQGTRSVADIEDEIFRKCVLSEVIKENIHKHKAGTISTTVACIMSISGPADINDFNAALDYHRELAQIPTNYIPYLICRAFPSYTIEDINNMDFGTMMLRLAQAEQTLMQTGLIQKPIRLFDQEAQTRRQPHFSPEELKDAHERAMGLPDPTRNEDIRRHKVELKEVPMKRVVEKPKVIQKPIRATKNKFKNVDEMPSPALDKSSDIMGLVRETMINPSLEPGDLDRQRMIADAQWIYADLLKELNEKKKKD